MAHPGRIVYAHPADRDGWRCLCVVYHPHDLRFSLRYARENGPTSRVEGSREEVLDYLENHLSDAGEIPARAAEVVRRYARGESFDPDA